jgi:hypothetical protein
MSEPKVNIKGVIQTGVTFAAVLVAACSLTYSITMNSMRPRVDILEKDSMELKLAGVRIDTKLTTLIESVNSLDKKFEDHTKAKDNG